MEKETNYKLIGEEALRTLIMTNLQQGFTISLLTYICYRQKIDAALTIPEVCEVLDITPAQLSAATRQCRIRPVGQGSAAYFSAYDLVVLSTRLRRKYVADELARIPSFIQEAGML